jgi:hypothetical protein
MRQYLVLYRSSHDDLPIGSRLSRPAAEELAKSTTPSDLERIAKLFQLAPQADGELWIVELERGDPVAAGKIRDLTPSYVEHG